jgi:hypothetical protein
MAQPTLPLKMTPLGPPHIVIVVVSLQFLCCIAVGAQPKPFFEDVTDKAGLKGVGGGRVSWGDYNNDGWDDLLVDGARLFRNNRDGTFTEVTQQARLAGGGGGGLWMDFNNDGWLDFVSTYGKNSSSRIFRNNGDGTFTDVSEAMGFASPRNSPAEGAAVGDFDRDGFVDIYLANYEKGEMGRGTPDVFWKNIGGKSFRDFTADAGMTVNPPRCGRGVACADYNNDGFLDIYVSNYRLNDNFLWQNNGSASFKNVAAQTGTRGEENSRSFGHTIGSAWGDLNNDGFLDLVCVQFAHPQYRPAHPMTAIYKNSGPPDWKFTNLNRNGAAGIRFEETHSSPALADFDNDGLLDVYITSTYAGRRSFFYRNIGEFKFTDITDRAGLRVLFSWGCAWADFDNDGKMDLAVVTQGQGGGVRLFRNMNPDKNHWLKIRLEGDDCNRAAIGARVTVKAGAKTLIREVEGGTGTSCQNSLTCHFGLGAHDGEVTVTVRWICGKEQSFTARANQFLHFKEGGETARVLMGAKNDAENSAPAKSVAPDAVAQPPPAPVAPLKEFGAVLRDFSEADTRGAVVIAVLENAAAARAGIEAGDIIIKLNDTEITSARQFELVFAQLENDSFVAVVILRDGKSLTLKLQTASEKKP